MATFTINRKGRPESFESTLSDSEALEAIHNSSSDFARDLYAKRSRLSPAQMAWVHKLAMESIERKQPKPVATGASIDMNGVEALFANAGSRLKRPQITIELKDGLRIQLRRAGQRSKYAGQIQITDGGAYGSSKYYGRIENGNFIPGRDVDANVRATLVELAKDPIDYAQKYGHKSGHCCFCGLKLTDERSVTAGYGETCAKHWGLPWGTSPNIGRRSPIARRSKIAGKSATTIVDEPTVNVAPEIADAVESALEEQNKRIAPWSSDDGVNFVVELSDLQAAEAEDRRCPQLADRSMIPSFPGASWVPSFLDDEMVGWTQKENGKTFCIFND